MYGADRFVVNTYSYMHALTVEACLSRLHAQGVRHVELMMAPGFLWPDDMDAGGFAHFRRFLAGHRIRVVSINMANDDLNITAMSPEIRNCTLDLLERFIRLGGELGAGGIVLGIGHSNPLMPAPNAQLQGHLFRGLDRLTKIAEEAGTQLWLENMPFTWETSAQGVMQLVDTFGDDRIGIVYDVANGWFVKEDVATALRTVSRRLRLVHLSDTCQKIYRHDRIGHGTVPFDRLPPLLAEVGYAEWPVLEIIDPDPDTALAVSVGHLMAAGFGTLEASAKDA